MKGRASSPDLFPGDFLDGLPRVFFTLRGVIPNGLKHQNHDVPDVSIDLFEDNIQAESFHGLLGKNTRKCYS